MKNKDFNPYIRYIGMVTSPQCYVQPVLAYDFRIFYCISGSFVIEMQDKNYQMLEGDLFILPPQIPYRLLFDKSVPKYYILNFDFVSSSDQYTPRPPDTIEKFSPDKVFCREFYGPFGEVFLINNAYICEKILEEIYYYDTDNSEHAKNLQSALLKYLLSSVAITKGNTATRSKNEKLIEEIKEYIDLNYNKGITNQTIAEWFNYHPYYLNDIFFKAEKITLHKYIDTVKLKNARYMLIHSNMTIGEIADECGFSDLSYFSKFFIKYMKITPRQYRNLTR